MSSTVKLTIDGREVSVPEGTNILDAAETAGVHVPNLCYMKGMKGVGACRLCLVEVEGGKAPLVACNAKVKEGMNVVTNTERILQSRKFVLDLILSMHPLDCMTCTKAGVCRLQEYAYEHEVKESSFTRKKFGYPTDEANPFIKRDPEYCILCGRCVRVCKEQGTNVLEFMGRGVGAKVVTAKDKPLQESECTFCGSCLDACPVNALLEADRWRLGREWEFEKVSSVCMLCGNGCDITVSTKEGKIQKINAGGAEGSAGNYICAYGRYGFDCIESETRVTAPMKRIDGELRETTWKDAVETITSKLKGAGNNAAFISVAGISNEDALALKKFAGSVVKTKHYDTTLSLYADAESMKASQAADIDEADAIILVDLNPSQWERVLPQLDASVRRKVDRGAKLIIVSSRDTRMDEIASVVLKGDEAVSLKALVKASMDKGLKGDKKLADAVLDAKVSEDVEKASAIFSGAVNPIVLSSPSLFSASSNLSLLKGKAVAVAVESNAKGVALMGLYSDGMGYKEIITGGAKIVYAVGEVPLASRPKSDFLVVQNSHLTELAKQADVVLPSAAFLESAGTMVDYMGRLKYLPKVMEPQGESKSHRDIFVLLAKALGSTMKKPTEAEVKKAAKSKSKQSVRAFERSFTPDIAAGDLIESVNASVINGSRLLWLKETEKAMSAAG